MPESYQHSLALFFFDPSVVLLIQITHPNKSHYHADSPVYFGVVGRTLQRK